MYDSETKKKQTVLIINDLGNSQMVPLRAHSCSVIIPVSFLLILANAFLDCALHSIFRVGHLLCLYQQPFFFFFGINSQRILDTLVKFFAVVTEFFYVDGWTDMLKLMFTFTVVQ
jgi:hypothetical protein